MVGAGAEVGGGALKQGASVFQLSGQPRAAPSRRSPRLCLMGWAPMHAGTRMAAAGVPMRTLQEWMGHRSVTTTQIYADYSPSSREADMIAAAFARGSIRGSNLSESESISENSTRIDMREST